MTTLNCREQAVAFPCASDTLLGVLAEPADSTQADTGIVIVVGGPQYRAGSHRQFTLLARGTATAGYPTLRFDCRGMGDSSGEPRSFEDVSADISAAIDALQSRLPTVKRIVLWGLCDGASASLIYLCETQDPRVRGLCLANPWIRSEQSLARTQVRHYYLRRLLLADFWRKVLRGGVGLRAVRELTISLKLALSSRSTRGSVGEVAAADFRQRMLDGLNAFAGPVLVPLSADDYTAKEFADFTRKHDDWQAALQRADTVLLNMKEADHTFSEAGSQHRLLECFTQWLNQNFVTHTVRIKTNPASELKVVPQ